MIYCVWYPSGGFGNFINSILTMHGQGFARSQDSQIKFSKSGNAHSFSLVAPRYFFDPDDYKFNFDETLNYSVLIDNGINDENMKFQTQFPNARIIKICYDQTSWAVIARTLIDKAMDSSIEKALSVDPTNWQTSEPWAVREKYFLYLKDHPLRKSWRPQADTTNLRINDMFNYFNLKLVLSRSGVDMEDFFDNWQKWRGANRPYIDPVENAQSIINVLLSSADVDLTYMKDIWSQAVLYYLLWLNFKKEVPHNDYADFFSNTQQIRTWLKL